MFIKKILLLIMGVQIFLYFVSLLLVSYYTPQLELEKKLSSLLIITMSINSVLFVFCKMLFILTLKYDLYFVSMNLQILPDIEYFVDLEENGKLTL